MPDANETLVLMSGGVDSTVLALGLRKRGDAFRGLYIDAGHTARHAEQRALRTVCGHLDVPFDVINICNLREAFTSSSATPFATVPNPGRHVTPLGSLCLFGIALPYALRLGVAELLIGYTTEDAEFSAEYRQDFLSLLSQLSATAGQRTIQVRAPLLHESLRMELDSESRALLALTYSCIYEGPEPCGSCQSCLGRERKLRRLGGGV